MLRDRVNILNTTLNLTSAKNSSENKNASKLTTSETQRNIGSVTFFLDPKVFEENAKNRSFFTNEMWLPIKDITVPSNAKLSVSLVHLISMLSLCYVWRFFSSSKIFTLCSPHDINFLSTFQPHHHNRKHKAEHHFHSSRTHFKTWSSFNDMS